MLYLFIFVHRGTDYASKGIKVYFQQVPHSYYLSFSSKTFLNNFFLQELGPKVYIQRHSHETFCAYIRCVRLAVADGWW